MKGEQAEALRQEIADFYSGKSAKQQVRYALLDTFDEFWPRMSPAE